MYVWELANVCTLDTQFITYLPDGHCHVLYTPGDLVDYYGNLQVNSICVDQPGGYIEISFIEEV